jgi:hypothetical protein
VRRVYVAENPIDASLVWGVVRSMGIESCVTGCGLWIARGGVPCTPDTAPAVWVLRDGDAQEAAEAVADLEARRRRGRSREGGAIAETEERPAPDSWRCARCGETHDDRFTACWRCEGEDPRADRRLRLLRG